MADTRGPWFGPGEAEENMKTVTLYADAPWWVRLMTLCARTVRASHYVANGTGAIVAVALWFAVVLPLTLAIWVPWWLVTDRDRRDLMMPPRFTFDGRRPTCAAKRKGAA